MSHNDKEVVKKDKGGTIYTLPSKTFEHYKGHEWFSRESIKPLSKKKVKSSLTTMMKNGVQVYFTDKKTFEEIEKAKDQGTVILNSLKSENEKRGLPVKQLDIHKR